MVSTLTCRLTPKIPDFNYVPVLDIWCEYDFILTQNQTETVLLHHEWDFVCFCEWVADHAESWLTEMLSIEGYPDSIPSSHESLSQTLDRLSDRDFDNEEDEFFWYQSLYEYRSSHNLQFGLRGAAIPYIIIGSNHDNGEIFCRSDKVNWSYTFAMSPFVETLIAEVQRVLTVWELLENDPRAIPLIANLRHRLVRLTERLAGVL